MEIKKRCTCKATKSKDIPIMILKQNADIFLTTFATFSNFCVNETHLWPMFSFYTPWKHQKKHFGIKHLATLMLFSRLRISAKKLFKWFKYNQMKDNAEKCHLMLITGDSSQIQIWNSLIKGSLFGKLL